MEQLPDKTATEFFASLPFKNEIDIEALDMNKDDYVDFTEIEKAMATCTTTYNPFDSDGDGIPDIDDQFPDDPSESKDADGDGIGDNADFAPSVATICSMVQVVHSHCLDWSNGSLRRGGGGSGQNMDQEWNKTDAFAEQMLNNLAPALR